MRQLISKVVFSGILICAIASPALAASNFQIYCAENVTGTTGARDFFVIGLQVPADLTPDQLRAHFFEPNTLRPVTIAIRHYRGLQHEVGQDVRILRDQMSAYPERIRGEPIIVNTNLGRGDLSYRGEYLSASGQPLSNREQWVRLVYVNHDNVQQRTYPVHFADRGFGAGTQSLLLKTYTCSAPDFFAIVEGEESPTVPPPTDTRHDP